MCELIFSTSLVKGRRFGFSSETKYEQDKHLKTFVTAQTVNWAAALGVHVSHMLCPIHWGFFEGQTAPRADFVQTTTGQGWAWPVTQRKGNVTRTTTVGQVS